MHEEADGQNSFKSALESFNKFINEGKEMNDKAETKRELLKNKESKNPYSDADIERVYDYPIFSIEDWLAYRAVSFFYLKDYRSTLADLKILEKMLTVQKKSYFDPEGETNMDSSLAQEIYEFRFSPMTFNECYYNMILCQILVLL